MDFRRDHDCGLRHDGRRLRHNIDARLRRSRQAGSGPIEHIAVVALPALVAALAAESQKHGILVEDGNVIVPPTRPHKAAEVRQLLTMRGVDGVLVVTVTGDTGVEA